jgi:hypothetical protein
MEFAPNRALAIPLPPEDGSPLARYLMAQRGSALLRISPLQITIT